MGCISITRQLLSGQVCLQMQGTDHGSAPLFEIQSVRQDHARLFHKDVTTGLPISNTWVHLVKVLVRACSYSVCVARACVCVCAHVTRKVWGLCLRHKRNVNTVYASPAVTSASASSLSSHLAARETPIQLDADSVSLDSHQTEKHKFNPVLPWAHCFTAG